MKNYFEETPYYQIWCDIITQLSIKTSFIPSTFFCSFSEIVCRREEVINTFHSQSKKLEIIYGHEDRIFFCRLSNNESGEFISWKNSPPKIVRFDNLKELEVEIDKWMVFLRAEL